MIMNENVLKAKSTKALRFVNMGDPSVVDDGSPTWMAISRLDAWSPQRQVIQAYREDAQR